MTDWINQVYQLAEELHRGQLRKDGKTPYIQHPRDVANLLETLECHDQAIIAAALLHDTLEDCNISIHDLFNRLHSFTPDLVLTTETITLVYQVSSPDKMWGITKQFNRKDRKIMTAAYESLQGWKAATLKACDRICNLRDVDSMNDPAFKEKYLDESYVLLNILQDTLINTDLTGRDALLINNTRDLIQETLNAMS